MVAGSWLCPVSVLDARIHAKAGRGTSRGSTESEGRSSHISPPLAVLQQASKAIHKADIELSWFGDWHLRSTSNRFQVVIKCQAINIKVQELLSLYGRKEQTTGGLSVALMPVTLTCKFKPK